MSSDVRLLGDLTILFFLGLVGILSGMKDYLFVRKVKDTPTSKVSSAAVGLVELAGEAEDKKPERSPVSRTPCTYWRVTGEYYHEGKHGGWRLFHTAQSRDDFYLQDDTGKMLIEPEGADVDIPPNQKFEGYIAEHGILFKGSATMEEPAMSYIRSLEKPEQERFMAYADQNIRISEYYIAENDPLYVLGSAVPAGDIPGPADTGSLEVTKGPFDRIMYISDVPENKVIERHSSWLYLRIFGGLTLSTVTLFFLLMALELVRDAFVTIGIVLILLCVCWVLTKLEVRHDNS